MRCNATLLARIWRSISTIAVAAVLPLLVSPAILYPLKLSNLLPSTHPLHQIPARLVEGTEAATADTESLLSAAVAWREQLSQRHSAWHVFKFELQRVSAEVCDIHGQLTVGVDSRPFGDFVGDLTALQAQLQVRMGWGLFLKGTEPFLLP